MNIDCFASLQSKRRDQDRAPESVARSRSEVRGFTSLLFVVTNGFQDGNWEVLTLCPWFESDFLRNYKSVLIEIWFQMLPRIWLI
jgi:hypothetical protein